MVVWAAAGLYLAIGTAILVANAGPHAQEQAVLKFATNMGLPLPQRLSEPIRRRMLSSRRSSIIGGMVGTVVSALVIATPPAAQWDTLEVVVVVAGAFTGMSVGMSIAAIRSTRPIGEYRVRYARATAVELNDYIAPLERWLTRFPVLLAFAATVAVAVLVHSGWAEYASATSSISAGVFVLLALVSLATFEIMARRVVTIGNRVGSPEELVWEDAARAQTIRELSGAPSFLGLYGILMSTNPLVIASGQGTIGFSLVALGIAFIPLLLALVLLVSGLRVQRHFLRRLWPELAAEADNPRLVEADG